MKLGVLLASTLGTAVIAWAGSAGALVKPSSWEVASEFNDSANPSGVWSYGYKPSGGGVGGIFQLMNLQVTRNPGNVIGWGIATDNSLAIVHNINPFVYVDQTQNPGVRYPAHALDIHVGNNCEISVLRFTAPRKGRYRISGAFYGLDDNGYENSGVQIVSNNNFALFTGSIDMNAGAVKTPFTSVTVHLLQGDTLDFQADCGTDATNNFDHVGLNAVIERTN